MHTLLPESTEGFVALRLSEKLDRDDFDQIIPILKEQIAAHGKIALYWEMASFDGWTTEALLADTGFDIEHHDDFTRIAMVGEKKWHKWMAKLMKPFTSAEVKYFEVQEREDGLAWAQEGD